MTRFVGARRYTAPARRCNEVLIQTISTDEGEEFMVSGRGPSLWTYSWQAVCAEAFARLKPRERQGRTANQVTDLVLSESWDSMRGWMGSTEPRRIVVSEYATEIVCKIDGCQNRWLKQKGPYGKLCAQHTREAQELNKKPRRQAAEKPTLADELVAKVQEVVVAEPETGFDDALARLQAARQELLYAETQLELARREMQRAYDSLADELPEYA